MLAPCWKEISFLGSLLFVGLSRKLEIEHVLMGR